MEISERGCVRSTSRSGSAVQASLQSAAAGPADTAALPIGCASRSLRFRRMDWLPARIRRIETGIHDLLRLQGDLGPLLVESPGTNSSREVAEQIHLLRALAPVAVFRHRDAPRFRLH